MIALCFVSEMHILLRLCDSETIYHIFDCAASMERDFRQRVLESSGSFFHFYDEAITQHDFRQQSLRQASIILMKSIKGKYDRYKYL